MARPSVSESLLKDLLERHQAAARQSLQKVTAKSDELKPAASYEDSGNGYNSDFTFPQQ